MAKRITPEFEPTRIVQPVASPVETFVQPVLVQPAAPTGGMQVAQALSSLSSSLSGLGEELLLERKQEDLAAGAMEDLSNFTPQQLRDYEEKAGGILPWRYQAALQAYGMNTARANYETKAFESLNFQAEPYNADGTPRTYEQVQQDLNKMWDESTKGLTGHYAKMGAMQVRAQVDNEFQNMWSQKRRSLIIQDNAKQLVDRVIKTLDNADNSFDALDLISVAQDSLYVLGMGASKELIIEGVNAWISNNLAIADSATEFDKMRSTIHLLMKEGIGGPLSPAFRSDLTKRLKDIEEAELNATFRDANVENQQVNNIRAAGLDILSTWLADQTVANGGKVPYLTIEQISQKVDTVLAEQGVAVDSSLYARAKGALIYAMRAQINSARAPVRSDSETYERLAGAALNGEENIESLVIEAQGEGLLSSEDAQSLIKQSRESSPIFRILGQGATSDPFKGMILHEPLDFFNKDIRQQVAAGVALAEMQATMETNSELAKLLREDPANFRAKAPALMAAIAKKHASNFQNEYKELLTNESLLNGFEAFRTKKDFSDRIEAGVDMIVPPPVTGIPVNPEDIQKRLEVRDFLEEYLYAQYSSPAIADLPRTFREREMAKNLTTYIMGGVGEYRRRNDPVAPTTEQAGAEAGPPTDPLVEAMPANSPQRQQVGRALALDPNMPGLDSGTARQAFEALDEIPIKAAERLAERFSTPSGLRYLGEDMGYGESAPAFVPVLLGIQSTEKALAELRYLVPTAYEAFSRSRTGSLRPQDQETIDLYNRYRQTLGNRLAIDEDATKGYWADVSLAGQLGAEEIKSGYSNEGVSIQHALKRGYLNPLTMPMFKNYEEFEADMKDPMGAINTMAAWSGYTHEEIAEAQAHVLIVYRRVPNDFRMEINAAE
jgi:hypothetical protein